MFIVPEYDFPEDYNALERLWYQDAMASSGEVAFDRINNAIVETSEFLKRISVAGQTQRQSGQEIMKAIERVNDHTMQVSASTEENVSTIEEFVTTIEAMNRITQEVSESGKEQVESTQLLSNTSLTLNQMTTDLKHMGALWLTMISEEMSRSSCGMPVVKSLASTLNRCLKY